MRKKVFGRRLKRDTNERKALFKGLMSSLILYESIRTTEEKAKAIRGRIDRIITKVKKKNGTPQDGLSAFLSDGAIKKLVRDVVPRLSERPGGYTRIVKIGKRIGDSADMVLMSWVGLSERSKVEKNLAKKAKKDKTERVKGEKKKKIDTKKEKNKH